MKNFSTIGLFCKENDERIEKTLNVLHQFLKTENFKVVAEASVTKYLDVPEFDTQELYECIDLAIVIGGDGTLLKAGRALSDNDIPVIGINLGRLGFLVDISPDQINQELKKMLDGEVYMEKRSLLHAEVFRGEKSLGKRTALNDVVFHVRDDIRMIEFTTHIDGKFVNTQRADGIVVATPTGSTAYALSSGGPILHPGLEAIALVPICPHTLSNRPIVVSNESKISISLCETRNVTARISFDGQANIELQTGAHVEIRHKAHRLHLMHPLDYNYFRILRNKLGWSVTP